MRSDTNLCAVATLVIHDGQEQAFQAIAKELSEATAKESGELTYQWYLTEDGKTCYVLERYADSDAVRKHLKTFGALGPRLLAVADLTNLEIYGNPDDQVRQAVSEATNNVARFHRPYAGFVR